MQLQLLYNGRWRIVECVCVMCDVCPSLILFFYYIVRCTTYISLFASGVVLRDRFSFSWFDCMFAWMKFVRTRFFFFVLRIFWQHFLIFIFILKVSEVTEMVTEIEPVLWNQFCTVAYCALLIEYEWEWIDSICLDRPLIWIHSMLRKV